LRQVEETVEENVAALFRSRAQEAGGGGGKRAMRLSELRVLLRDPLAVSG
jgi:hypothetical protein